MKKVRGETGRLAEREATYGEPRVKIAELKAHLSRHLQAVREGGEVVVLDRKTPIARIVPYQLPGPKLIVREPTRPFGSVKIPPHPRKRVDSVKALLEDRNSGR